jgi:hypothetical protein
MGLGVKVGTVSHLWLEDWDVAIFEDHKLDADSDKQVSKFSEPETYLQRTDDGTATASERQLQSIIEG